MLIILLVDFKGFTKTSFVSKLKAHPGKVHIAIVVGTECRSSETSRGHTPQRPMAVEPEEGCNSSYRAPLRQR